MTKFVIYLSIALVGGGGIYLRYLQRRVALLSLMLEQERLRARSGRASIGGLPSAYPYDRADYYPLGGPVDGVQISDDRVVLVTFRRRSEKLTARQEHVKRLLKAGKVAWEEMDTDGR